MNRKVRELTRDLKKAVRPKAEEPDPELAMELEALAAKNDALEVQVGELKLWKTEAPSSTTRKRIPIREELEESYRERVRLAGSWPAERCYKRRATAAWLAALKAQKETKVVVKDAYFSRKGSTSIIKEKEALQAKLKDRDKGNRRFEIPDRRYKKLGERSPSGLAEGCVQGDKYREAAARRRRSTRE